MSIQVRLGIIFLTVFCVNGAASFASPGQQPQKIIYPPSLTFIPSGFDDNDQSEVVLYGEFPNTCYKKFAVDTPQVDAIRKEIHLTYRALFYPGCWCLDVLSPFDETVKLGVLSAGQYTIYVHNQNQAIPAGILQVKHTLNPSPDDYLYAPVKELAIDEDHSRVTLRGFLKSDCVHYKESKVLYHDNHTIDILPITEVTDSAHCQPLEVPFKEEVTLSPAAKGKTLIYVRTLNGGSLTQIVTF